jgi:hypothetical protein
MGIDVHHLIFFGEASWLTPGPQKTLTDQEKCDLAWCEYADFLACPISLDGPAAKARLNIISKRFKAMKKGPDHD